MTNKAVQLVDYGELNQANFPYSVSQFWKFTVQNSTTSSTTGLAFDESSEIVNCAEEVLHDER